MIDHLNELIAFVERIIADASDAVSNGYARQSTATRERRRTDGSHAVGNGYARQSTATVERSRADVS